MERNQNEFNQSSDETILQIQSKFQNKYSVSKSPKNISQKSNNIRLNIQKSKYQVGQLLIDNKVSLQTNDNNLQVQKNKYSKANCIYQNQKQHIQIEEKQLKQIKKTSKMQKNSQNYLHQYFKSKQHAFPDVDILLINKKIQTLSNLLLIIDKKTDIKSYLLQNYSLSSYFKNVITKISDCQVIQIFSQDKKQIIKKQFYIGQFQQQKKHGYGLLAAVYYQNGQNERNNLKNAKVQFYEGKFNNDQKHGLGKQYRNNFYYIGRFLNDKQNSRLAVIIDPNSNIYIGEVVNNYKSGFGFLYVGITHNRTYFVLQNSSTFFKQIIISRWKFDLPIASNCNTNQDVISLTSKLILQSSIYEGQIQYQIQKQQYIKSGKGRQVFLQGDVCQGQFRQNKLDGQGKYIWKNGNIYIGQFTNGLCHGKGYWKQQSTQDQYEGQYSLNKKNGKGFYKWGKGNFYFGQFQDNKRHGKGKMEWTTGQIYNGYWKNGFQNGKGQIWMREQNQIRFIRQSQFINGIQLQKVQKKQKSKKPKKNVGKSIEIIKNQTKESKNSGHTKHKSQFSSSLASNFPMIKRHITAHTQPIEQIINNDKSIKHILKRKKINTILKVSESSDKYGYCQKQGQDHNKTKKIIYKPTKIKVLTQKSQTDLRQEHSKQKYKNQLVSSQTSVKQKPYLPKIQYQNLKQKFKSGIDKHIQNNKMKKQTTVGHNNKFEGFQDIKTPLKWKSRQRKHVLCYRTQLIQK